MAKQAAATTSDYLSELGISPQTLSAISAYYQPGGGFQQTLSTEMVPTGQGGYTAAPAYATATPNTGIDYPIGPAYPSPILSNQGPIVQPAPAAPAQPPPPPAAQMNWSGLASSLQSMLAPYLSGAANPAQGNPMATITPTLLNSLAGYLGTLQPTAAGQQAAASQTSLNPNAQQQGGTMNWSGLQSMLQSALAPYMSGASNPATANSGNALQGQLLNSLAGYLGTVPSSQLNAATTTPSTTPTTPSYTPAYSTPVFSNQQSGQPTLSYPMSMMVL